MPCHPKSKAQARFFGAVIGGEAKGTDLSPKKLRSSTRGVKHSKLPEKKRKKSNQARHSGGLVHGTAHDCAGGMGLRHE